MYTVVCLYPSGVVHRQYFVNQPEAVTYLDECRNSGRFASGSIWTDDEEEISGFAASVELY